MKKRVLSAILAMCMVLLLLPMVALAVEDYNLWVGGVQVTDANKNNITGGGINSDPGTVSYDPDSKTLTLNNANITGKDVGSGGNYGIYTPSADLTIELVGSNTVIAANISGEKESSAISVPNNYLVISGEGSLTASGGHLSTYGSYGSAGISAKLLMINGGTVVAQAGTTFNSMSWGIYTRTQPIFNGGTITATGHSVAIKLAPDLEAYTNVQVTASANIGGGSPVAYNALNIADYKYLKFEQGSACTIPVTLPTGTGYTITPQIGASSPVAHGGSYSFTIVIADGYHKGSSFAVKANGTALAANGSGIYTISNITEAQAVTVEGVVQNVPAPSGGDGGSTPPADTTVYNDPSKPNATIWLSGSGLNGNDLLVTQAIASGGNFNALLKLADSGDILGVYNISLQSGRSSTGSAMYLTFDLTGQYAGQTFTLVHKKADSTFEYLYATAGADGKVKFGPVYELSPFMLVNGSLLQAPAYKVAGVPKTGDNFGSLGFVLLILAAVGGAGVRVYRKKRTQA